MKIKQVISLSLILFFLGNIFSQNAFHDAKFIVEKASRIRENQKKLEKLKPLSAELDSIDAAEIADFNQIVKFIDNPFDTTVQFNQAQIRQILSDIPKIASKVTALRDTTKSRDIPVAYGNVNTAKISGISGTSLSAIPSTSFL